MIKTGLSTKPVEQHYLKIITKKKFAKPNNSFKKIDYFLILSLYKLHFYAE